MARKSQRKIIMPFKDPIKKKEYQRKYKRQYMKKYRAKPEQKAKRDLEIIERNREKAEMLTVISQTLERLNPFDLNALVQINCPSLKAFYKDYGDYKANIEPEPNESEEEFKERQSFESYKEYYQNERVWIENMKIEQKRAVKQAISFLMSNDPRIHKWMQDFPEFFIRWI